MKNILNKIFLKIAKPVLILTLLYAGFMTRTTAQPIIDSKGTDFWLMFNRNINTPVLTVFITSDVNTSGTVTIPGLSFSAPFTVSANNVTPVVIPVAASVHTSGVIDDKGIHVTALQEVTAYGLNYAQFTTDAYLGLPTDALGKDYIVISYQGNTLSEFGIVGTVNGTVVTINQSVTAGGRTAGVPYNITLNQGQTYEVGGGTDLSGTFITATQPIGVMGANACANIPPGAGFCDHICEMLPPTTTWGKKFGTVPLKARTSGDTWRFLASENGTTVTINGVAQTPVLNRGQFLERILTDQSVIESTQPILVAQFANGSQFSGNPGDPFMMLIPPLEQFLAKYTVTTVAGYVAHYINVVAPASVVGTLTLDGVPVPMASFTPIGTTGFSGAQLTVAAGTHNLFSTLPFGVFMYGFNTDDSYGYPGGQSFSAVATVKEVSTITAPPSGTSPVGISNCFSATVRDQFGNPVPGVRVDYTITGTNPGSSGFAFSDANGVATFCYSGPNPGTDQIIASVGLIVSAPATFIWTPVDILNCTDPVTNRLFVNAAIASSGTGGSWACAKKTLNEAVTIANGNPAITSIWVAQGTYTNGVNPNATMFIGRANLSILGGFNGTETLASQANPTLNPTIISGDIGTIGDNTDNTRLLFFISAVPNDANRLVIDGFTFADANGTDGAAIQGSYNTTATPVTIRRSLFRNNTASNSGGAVALDNSPFFFDSCRFVNNRAGFGGAVRSFQSTLLAFYNCVFVQNTGTLYGGAYYGNFGLTRIIHCAFNGNRSEYGGAVYQSRVDVEYYNSVISNNMATVTGGGVHQHDRSNSLHINTTFYQNAARLGGGFTLGFDNCHTTVWNNIFYKNTADGASDVAYADIYNLSATVNNVQTTLLQTGSLVPANNGANYNNNIRGGVNPQFLNEASPVGGDAAWFTADDGLQLTGASTLRNIGRNDLSAGPIDLRSNPRIACGQVDLGAYEFQACPPVAPPVATFIIADKPAIAGAVVNPFTSDLQVKYAGDEKAGIRVIAVAGKAMAVTTAAPKGITHINAANWAPGIYQVEVLTESGKKIHFKVVKL